MVKKTVRKKVLEKCKKISKCPYCKDTNGVVKKMTASKTGSGGSVLKIVHEKYGSKNDQAVKNQVGTIWNQIIFSLSTNKLFLSAEFNKAVEMNPELKTIVSATSLSQILTPIDVLNLFERIPDSDITLLAMDSKR